MSRKAHTRNFPVLFVIAALTFLATEPAEASEISINGNFARGSTANNSPLKSGTFALTFDVNGLPVRSGSELFLNSFDLVFRSAAGFMLAGVNGLQSGSFGTLQPLTGNTSGDELRVGNSTSQTDLFLLLPGGFTGTGDVIRSSAHSYGIINGSDKLAVRAGAVTSEPHAAEYCLVGLSVLGISALKGKWKRSGPI
jgi:hypothetical protein